jgi:hypothetical protein
VSVNVDCCDSGDGLGGARAREGATDGVEPADGRDGVDMDDGVEVFEDVDAERTRTEDGGVVEFPEEPR